MLIGLTSVARMLCMTVILVGTRSHSLSDDIVSKRSRRRILDTYVALSQAAPIEPWPPSPSYHPVLLPSSRALDRHRRTPSVSIPTPPRDLVSPSCSSASVLVLVSASLS